MSVCEITNPASFDKGKFIVGGLADLRMGTAERHVECQTCKNTYRGGDLVNDCPGHFGHISLVSPVFHLGFFDELYKLLQCICHRCSRLLADRGTADFAAAAKV